MTNCGANVEHSALPQDLPLPVLTTTLAQVLHILPGCHGTANNGRKILEEQRKLVVTMSKGYD